MTIYSYLYDHVDDADKTITRLAYSAIHKYCSPFSKLKDLSSHYPDLFQEIIGNWLEVELEVDVEQKRSLSQVITYAQSKARYCIQEYLEKMEHSLAVPREVSRGNRVARSELEMIEDADLGWEDRGVEYHADELTSFNGWQSVYYSRLPLIWRWVIFFLSTGFSVAQAATLVKTSRRQVYRVLDMVRDSAEQAEKAGNAET